MLGLWARIVLLRCCSSLHCWGPAGAQEDGAHPVAAALQLKNSPTRLGVHSVIHTWEKDTWRAPSCLFETRLERNAGVVGPEQPPLGGTHPGEKESGGLLPITAWRSPTRSRSRQRGAEQRHPPPRCLPDYSSHLWGVWTALKLLFQVTEKMQLNLRIFAVISTVWEGVYHKSTHKP